MSEVIPAFAAGSVNRNATLRRGFVAQERLAAGARILALWNDHVPVREGQGLYLTASLGPAGAADGGLIYLGQADGIGDVLAQDLGSQDPAPPLPEGCTWTDLRQSMLQMSPTEAELAATAKALQSWHKTHRFCSACGAPSDMAEAGWQRLCPVCHTAHFPRTDPVVIMLVTKGDRLLLGRSPGWPDGMYSTLAGFMEPGETVEAAVRREVAEESGIVVGQVRYISSQPWPFPASLMIGCHGLAETEEITIDPEELEDALWVTRAEMVSVLAGLHPKIKPMRRGAIAHALVVNWLADRKN